MTDLKNLIIRLKNDHILEKKTLYGCSRGSPEILNPPNCWARKPAHRPEPVWPKDLYPGADRIYQLLPERLLLLRYPVWKPPCGPIPAESG